jgi:hypothetical protein
VQTVEIDICGVLNKCTPVIIFKEILLVAKRIGTYIMEEFSIGSPIQIPVLGGAW